MSSRKLSHIVIRPLSCDILASKIVKTKPCSQELLIEFSNALVKDAKARADAEFARLNGSSS